MILLHGTKSFLLFFALILTACIEKYDADVDITNGLLSVEASLIEGRNEQFLQVTRSTNLTKPEINYVSGCSASIIDDQNNIFPYSEYSDGQYEVTIPEEFLDTERMYKLHLITPDGEVYESSYEKLQEKIDMDSVYFRIEEVFDNITLNVEQGVQFYVDLKAPDSLSRYYRWKCIETYEFESISPVTYYVTDRPTRTVYLSDEYEYFRCWKTVNIRDLFISNTINLSTNEKKEIPLNFVSEINERLEIRYSLLVQQYPLSEEAFNYWQKAMNETQESGGLYTQQPGQHISNIYNIDDEDEAVLGYFWTSSVAEKRLFVEQEDIDSLQVVDNLCTLMPYDPLKHDDGPFPRYFYVDKETREVLTTNMECLNCVKKGGDLDPPDYW